MVTLQDAIKQVTSTVAQYKIAGIRETKSKWLFSVLAKDGAPLYLGGWLAVGKQNGERSVVPGESKEEKESTAVQM